MWEVAKDGAAPVRFADRGAAIAEARRVEKGLRRKVKANGKRRVEVLLVDERGFVQDRADF